MDQYVHVECPKCGGHVLAADMKYCESSEEERFEYYVCGCRFGVRYFVDG